MLGFEDEAVPGATHILAVAQGAGGEATDEDVYFVTLVGVLLHLV